MEKALIFSKIPKIMKSVGVVGKDKTNSMQGYKFRGIDDMYNALNSHLAEEGVFITSEIIERTREERETKNGGVLLYTILRMKFKFYAEDGSFVESVTEGEAMDSSDKSTNKAMSVAYKYALMQIFCIPTEEEKDTEYQTPEPKAKITAQQADRFANEFNAPTTPQAPSKKYENKPPAKWINDEDFERMKSKFMAGDNPAQKIKQLRDAGFGVSKATAELITTYINQL